MCRRRAFALSERFSLNGEGGGARSKGKSERGTFGKGTSRRDTLCKGTSRRDALGEGTSEESFPENDILGLDFSLLGTFGGRCRMVGCCPVPNED